MRRGITHLTRRNCNEKKTRCIAVARKMHNGLFVRDRLTARKSKKRTYDSHGRLLVRIGKVAMVRRPLRPMVRSGRLTLGSPKHNNCLPRLRLRGSALLMLHPWNAVSVSTPWALKLDVVLEWVRRPRDT